MAYTYSPGPLTVAGLLGVGTDAPTQKVDIRDLRPHVNLNSTEGYSYYDFQVNGVTKWQMGVDQNNGVNGFFIYSNVKGAYAIGINASVTPLLINFPGDVTVSGTLNVNNPLRVHNDAYFDQGLNVSGDWSIVNGQILAYGAITGALLRSAADGTGYIYGNHVYGSGSGVFELRSGSSTSGLKIQAGTVDEAYIREGTTYEFYVYKDLSAASIQNRSDLRLKDNVQPLAGALDAIASMDGISFDRKDGKGHRAGLNAESVAAVAPELVGTDQDGWLNIDLGGTIGYLVEAVKELRAEVAALKADMV